MEDLWCNLMPRRKAQTIRGLLLPLLAPCPGALSPAVLMNPPGPHDPGTRALRGRGAGAAGRGKWGWGAGAGELGSWGCRMGELGLRGWGCGTGELRLLHLPGRRPGLWSGCICRTCSQVPPVCWGPAGSDIGSATVCTSGKSGVLPWGALACL